MKLKRRVWIIFAALAAVLLILSTARVFGRKIYTPRDWAAPEEPFSIGCGVGYDPGMRSNITQSSLIMRGTILDSESGLRENAAGDYAGDYYTRFTVSVDEIWYGEEDARTITLTMPGLPGSYYNKPVKNDRVVLFLGGKEGNYSAVYNTYCVFVVNPPFNRIFPLAHTSEYGVYHGGSVRKLRKSVDYLVDKYAAQVRDPRYGGSVVREYYLEHYAE